MELLRLYALFLLLLISISSISSQTSTTTVYNGPPNLCYNGLYGCGCTLYDCQYCGNNCDGSGNKSLTKSCAPMLGWIQPQYYGYYNPCVRTEISTTPTIKFTSTLLVTTTKTTSTTPVTTTKTTSTTSVTTTKTISTTSVTTTASTSTTATTATTTTICVVSVSGQIPASSQCQPSTCGAPVASCSTNSDCECLALSSGGGGVCAALLSCSSLTPCLSDNLTCTVPYTVCVVRTRCNKPMCYPLALAVPQVCPPLNSNATISTVSTSA
ncbi:unnamed protein product, partial [Rotaria socialis]